jgi:hypothetical protein
MVVEVNEQQRAAVLKAMVKVVETADAIAGRWAAFDDEAIDGLVARLRDICAKRKTTHPCLSPGTMSSFLFDRVEEMFGDKKPERGAGKRLVDVPPFGDPEAVAGVLAAGLFTLPWEYRVILQTPVPIEGTDSSEFELDDQFSLRRYIGSDPETARIRSALSRIEGADGRFDLSRWYFVAAVKGYIPELQDTGIVDEVMHAWAGLLGLLMIDGSASLIGYERSKLRREPILIFRVEGGVLTPMPSKWMSDVMTNFLRTSVVVPSSDPGQRVATAFRNVSIRGAARWYLDSFSEPRGAQQIVQAMTVFEILFGDETEEKQLGLASLLANRVAYMVGRTPDERSKILRDFKRLYKLRSKIIHAGKAALEDDERRALVELRAYAYSAMKVYIDGLRQTELRPSP